MDRSYKEDIPRAKKTLEELKKEFSGVAPTTDWTKLRIEPMKTKIKLPVRLGPEWDFSLWFALLSPMIGFLFGILEGFLLYH
jgi:hypothetical protein